MRTAIGIMLLCIKMARSILFTSHSSQMNVALVLTQIPNSKHTTSFDISHLHYTHFYTWACTSAFSKLSPKVTQPTLCCLYLYCLFFFINFKVFNSLELMFSYCSILGISTVSLIGLDLSRKRLNIFILLCKWSHFVVKYRS